MRQLAPVRIEHHAVAVEDELVLTAHGVHPRHEGAVVGRAPTDHRFTRGALTVVVWGAVDVDQDLRAVMRLPGHRTGGEPAVLAHRETEAHAIQLEDRAAVAGLEVALLVKHTVVGQENLVEDGLDLAAVDERRGVEDVAFLVDKPDDCRDVPGRLGDRLQLGDVVAHEGRFED